MTLPSQAVDRGQAVYTKSLLAFYDLYVLGLSSRLIWRCPVKRVLELYNRRVTANHLDVGVGTGFFLDRCAWPTSRPRIGLLDLNPNCLEAASRRLARYRPEVYRANVLEPIPYEMKKFDSISLTWLLHCLPGAIPTKTAVFEHLKGLLNPGGVIFGATLLNEGVPHNWASRRLMALYNAKGIFTNLHDDIEGLKKILSANLSRTTVETAGSAALFSGISDGKGCV